MSTLTTPAAIPAEILTPAPMPTPYRWLAVDIETVAGTPTEAEEWMRLNWTPDARLKPETLGRRFLDGIEAKRQKLALLVGAPVIIVSTRSDTGEVRCLHTLCQHEPRQAYGALVEAFPDQAGLLVALRGLLENLCTPETLIVGHNVRDFDLPKLRNAYIRENVRIPAPLASQEQPVFDTMRTYNRFTTTKDPFIGLHDLLTAFGLDSHKTKINGAMVGELHAAGRFDELIEYAIKDVNAEAAVFELMTGQAAGTR
ncbi:MAG: ribonuclease H-like domain-containing protein [Phycisphaerae bacterium]|nr:ribonuclease H-like domain-containing protein [Phycisphaerae bacterium]